MNVTIIMCYVVKQVFVDIMMTFAEVESYHGTNLGSLVGLKWNKQARYPELPKPRLSECTISTYTGILESFNIYPRYFHFAKS